MKLSKKSKKRLILASAFFLPMFVLLVVFAVQGIAPFGGNTLLIADSYGQYDAFWTYYRELLTGERDAFYSFSKTIGGSMAGLFAYYLASPLNILFALFPADKLYLALHMNVLLKLSLCGLTFAIFWLRTNRGGWRVLLLSSAYALCAYNIGFCWSIMWLDGVALLPLIALGLHRLVEGRRPWLYVFSLGAAIICSYYIGFMLCIFSLLYYFYLVSLKTERWKKIDWKNVSVFALSSLCAGALSAVVLLPGILSMRGGKRVPMGEVLMEYITRYAYPLFARLLPGREAQYESYARVLLVVGAAAVIIFMAAVVAVLVHPRSPRKLRIAAVGVCCAGFAGYNFIRGNFVLVKLLSATTTADQMYSGNANIFTGVLTVILAAAFIFGRRTEKRERTASACLLAVLLISMCSVAINLIWHGFTENNSFNYRYSFIVSFFLLILAGKALDRLESISMRDIAIGSGAAVLLAIFGLVLQPSYVNIEAVLGDVVLAAAMGAALCIATGRSGIDVRHAVRLAAIVLAAAHIGNLMYSSSATIGSMLDKYQRTTAVVGRANEDIAELDSAISDSDIPVRVRKDEIFKGLNDTIQAGYNGTGSFSSAEKTDVIDFLAQIGWQTYGNIWSSGEYGSTRAADALMGVRWLADDDGEWLDYQSVSGSDLLLNPYALPIGFVTESLPQEVSPSDCPFEYMNDVFACLIPELDEPIFTPAQALAVSPSDVAPVSGSDASPADIMVYRVDVTSDNALYFYLDAAEYQYTDVYLNGKYYELYFDYHRPNTLLLGCFEPGEQVEVVVARASSVMAPCKTYFYYEDEEVLGRCCELLTAQSAVTESETDSHLCTTLSVAEDSCLIYTIPSDDGWRVTVDGEDIEPQQALGLFIAVPVEQGEHTVELTFRPQGMKVGAAVSLISLAVIAAVMIIDRRKGYFVR